MNDVSVPFNSTIVDPYEHYKMIKNEKLENSENVLKLLEMIYVFTAGRDIV